MGKQLHGLSKMQIAKCHAKRSKRWAALTSTKKTFRVVNSLGWERNRKKYRPHIE